MTVRRILLYGEPQLEAHNSSVESFDWELETLVRDMLDTCRAAPGLGLAAPQIGINLRLAVIDLTVLGGKTPLVLANPEIVRRDGSTVADEGCLSLPGLYAAISRPRQLRVRHQDLAGEWREQEAEDLLARAVCHELDHLHGTLIVHHLRGLKRTMFLRRVDKMRRSGAWPGPPHAHPMASTTRG